MKLSQGQKLRIYCVKYGHARYVSVFWGQVSCGRCGEVVGDLLTSVYNCKDKLVIGCKDVACMSCDNVRKSLLRFDKKILSKLENECSRGD